MKKLVFFVLLVSLVVQFGCTDKSSTDSTKGNEEKISTSASSVSDEADNEFHQEFHCKDIRGNYQDGKQEMKLIESEEDMNYLLEKLDVSFSEDIVTVQTEISGERVESELKLYPSQIGDEEKQADKILGVEQKTDTNAYSVLKFTINRDADEESLLIPNQKWKGETVLSLAYYHNNDDKKEKYYFQLPLDDLDYDSIYQVAEDNLKNDAKMREKIMDVELAYFSMEPLEEFLERVEDGNSLQISDGNKGSAEAE